MVYSDNIAIDESTLGDNDVEVGIPAGGTQTATFVNAETVGSNKSVTYRIAAPGGTLDAADNGIYSVTMLATR